MFSLTDLPPRWTSDAATFRRRGQKKQALFLESYLAELEAEMLADGHDVSAKARSEMTADYTVAQVAEMFDRKSQTIRDWIKKGRLRGYLFNGREYRITTAALADFQEGQRKGRTTTERSGEKLRDLRAWRAVPTRPTPT